MAILLGREQRAVLLRPPGYGPGPVGDTRRGAADGIDGKLIKLCRCSQEKRPRGRRCEGPVRLDPTHIFETFVPYRLKRVPIRSESQVSKKNMPPDARVYGQV